VLNRHQQPGPRLPHGTRDSTYRLTDRSTGSHRRRDEIGDEWCLPGEVVVTDGRLSRLQEGEGARNDKYGR
jgi:hypothetical protein